MTTTAVRIGNNDETLTDLGATLDAVTIATKERPSHVREIDRVARDDEQRRYADIEMLGEGGMGVVRLSEDRHIGRRVAMKVMRHNGDDDDAVVGSPALRDRFLREARVQGQLEHPAIVPVYDIASTTETGGAFFTMKRVRGSSLDAVLDDLRAADKNATVAKKYRVHKLLASFEHVCLAIDYAHARGVIHRDLKPANIMLGGFGEVYVLDWGLAKIVAGSSSSSSNASTSDVDDAQVNIDTFGEPTGVGVVLGTPAYAAPEQLRGELVDARTDVWALGAILFEMLTLEPLNPSKGNVAVMMKRTIDGELDARCSVRAPHRDVPPELEAICVKATAHDPHARYQTAREMQVAIESFLSGDRDRDARKTLARGHEDLARKAAIDARSGSLDARARALTEIGRALALDPQSPAAMALLCDLVEHAPRVTPPEVESKLEVLAEKSLRMTIPIGGILYIVLPPVLLFLPLALWMGVKNLPMALACVGVFMITGALFYWTYRSNRMGRAMPWLVPLASITVACASPLVGPFFLVPALAAVNAAVFCASAPRVNRWFVILTQWLAVLAPLGLEQIGLGPVTHEFLPDGSLRIASACVKLSAGPTIALLVMSSLLVIAAGGFFLGRFADAIRLANKERLTQKWQIEQLLPREARVAHNDD